MAPFVPAIPLLTTATACGDYGLTVAPYIAQFQKLPYRVLDAAFSFNALKEVYVSTNPLIFGFALSLFLAPIFLVVSEITRNYSQVDRCWSLLPTLYNVHYAVWAHLAGVPTQRLNALALVSILWSVSDLSRDVRTRLLTPLVDAPLIQLLAQRWIHGWF